MTTERSALSVFQKLRRVLVAIVLASLTGHVPEAKAITLGPWSMSGPGSFSIDDGGSHQQFTYAFFPSGTTQHTWTAYAPVLESGVFEFDYNMTSTYGPTADTSFLETFDPVTILASATASDFTSGLFTAFGSASIFAVAGETIGFRFGGSNTNANGYLIGSLSVGTVPLPPALLLLLGAFASLGVVSCWRRDPA